MSELLLSDAALCPDLFIWEGCDDAKALRAWLRERRLSVPDDLVELWAHTGGGDIFETETLLGPFRSPELGDDLDGANAAARQRGMPEGYVLFHIGLRYSAVRKGDGRYVIFEPGNFREESVYESLGEWYELFLRREYAARYGLPDR